MNNKILYLLSILFLTACSSEKEKSVISYEGLEKHIVELSSDRYQGRKPFSEGEKLSLDYISGEYKKLGLEAPFNGSYFQEVSMVEINTRVSDVMKIKKGRKSVDFKISEDYAAFTQRIQDVIDIKNTEIVFAGYGINAPEYNWNDFDGLDVKDKIIVVLVNDPGLVTEDSSLFKGRSMTYYGRWTYKFEEAARQGAKGVFIVHTDEGAGYPWGVVDTKNYNSQLYLKPDNDNMHRCEFEGWLTYSGAKKLFDIAGAKGFENVFADAAVHGYKGFTLNTKASLKLENTFNYNTSQNVIGMIPGTTKADECIIYTGHWDHLGIVQPDENGDTIVNGATDNAASVAWMLEIAKAFKALPEAPKRSIIFISPTAEESGLLGSYWYADHPVIPMDKTIACFNNDVILFLGRFKDVTITGYGQSELDDLVAEVAKEQGRYVLPDQQPSNGMYYRSDHFPYAKKGVPSLFAKGYSHHEVKGFDWTQEQIKLYWKNTYHKPCDEYIPERDDLTGLVDDSELLFNLGLKLANENIYPKWKEGSEFKAIREEQK